MADPDQTEDLHPPKNKEVARKFGCMLAIAVACLIVSPLVYSLVSIASNPPGQMVEKRLTSREAQELTLLDPEFVLPAGAKDVRVLARRWLDTNLFVRFDAPRDSALAFAKDYVQFRGGEATSCGVGTEDRNDLPPCEDVVLDNGCGFINTKGVSDWWLSDCPTTAMYGEQRSAGDRPAREIVVVPRGQNARVYIETWGD